MRFKTAEQPFIEIPFKQEMALLVSTGQKTKTTRNKQYGAAGAFFYVNGLRCILTEVAQYTLEHVANTFYREEGFFSPEDFKQYWNKLHPRNGWHPAQLVWVHTFALSPPTPAQAGVSVITKM